MTDPIPVFDAEAVRAVTTIALADQLVAGTAASRARLWASMFLVGLTNEDSTGQVRRVLTELALAAARGVDVRVLIDDFVTAGDGARPNAPASDWLTRRDVPVRISGVGRRRSVHAKYLLVDEQTALIGSGNLTPGALTSNSELGLQVFSTNLCRALADSFEREWAKGRPWRGATDLVDSLETPEPTS